MEKVCLCVEAERKNEKEKLRARARKRERETKDSDIARKVRICPWGLHMLKKSRINMLLES